MTSATAAFTELQLQNATLGWVGEPWVERGPQSRYGPVRAGLRANGLQRSHSRTTAARRLGSAESDRARRSP